MSRSSFSLALTPSALFPVRAGVTDSSFWVMPVIAATLVLGWLQSLAAC